MLTAAGALCLAATGTAAATWTAPSAPPAQAVDMLSFHSLTRAHHAGKAHRTAQLNLAEQAVVLEAADRVAAAHAAARAAAIRVAAERAAARRAAWRAAAQRAAAEAAVQRALMGVPRWIADQMLPRYGWAGQFSCLDELWARESGWNVYAENPSSGAYGIPQALPESKMASAGPDWQSDAATQISWGLGYIFAAYGSPCAAWDHEEAAGWY